MQVHGLQGGSQKTWSLSPGDPWTFWPKEWLPYESGFRHVRIHSFGYDSDWTKAHQSTLTIHDFAQALLADMHNSPNLKRNGNVSIPKLRSRTMSKTRINCTTHRPQSFSSPIVWEVSLSKRYHFKFVMSITVRQGH